MSYASSSIFGDEMIREGVSAVDVLRPTPAFKSGSPESILLVQKRTRPSKVGN